MNKRVPDQIELQDEVDRLRSILNLISDMPSGSGRSIEFYHNQYHNIVHAARAVILRNDFNGAIELLEWEQNE